MQTYRLQRSGAHAPDHLIGEVAVFGDGAAVLYRPATEQPLALWPSVHELMLEMGKVNGQPLHLEPVGPDTPASASPEATKSVQNGAKRR